MLYGGLTVHTFGSSCYEYLLLFSENISNLSLLLPFDIFDLSTTILVLILRAEIVSILIVGKSLNNLF